MSELTLTPASKEFIGVKLTDVAERLDELEDKPLDEVQVGVQQIITASSTSAIDSVPDLGFGMRAIALGAQRELEGLQELHKKLYTDVEIRVRDEMLLGSLWRIISGQEQFITEYYNRRSDKERMRSLRQDYVREFQLYESNLKLIAREEVEKRTVAILLGGLAVGMAPSHIRNVAKKEMLKVLAS